MRIPSSWTKVYLFVFIWPKGDSSEVNTSDKETGPGLIVFNEQQNKSVCIAYILRMVSLFSLKAIHF